MQENKKKNTKILDGVYVSPFIAQGLKNKIDVSKIRKPLPPPPIATARPLWSHSTWPICHSTKKKRWKLKAWFTRMTKTQMQMQGNKSVNYLNVTANTNADTRYGKISIFLNLHFLCVCYLFLSAMLTSLTLSLGHLWYHQPVIQDIRCILKTNLSLQGNDKRIPHLCSRLGKLGCLQWSVKSNFANVMVCIVMLGALVFLCLVPVASICSCNWSI